MFSLLFAPLCAALRNKIEQNISNKLNLTIQNIVKHPKFKAIYMNLSVFKKRHAKTKIVAK